MWSGGRNGDIIKGIWHSGGEGSIRLFFLHESLPLPILEYMLPK